MISCSHWGMFPWDEAALFNEWWSRAMDILDSYDAKYLHKDQ